jgi:prevent-host-death family protein
MSTEKLRRNLSQIINRAAYGMDPVLVTRRGLKMVAVISMDEEREDAGT